MRRRIILSLLILFILFSAGSLVAVLNIKNTTDTLNRLITLHQIENLRHHLIISIQTVQSDLYTAYTMLGQRADTITDNVTNLNDASQKCSECHHTPGITAQIEKVDSLISQYENALSNYLTASANKQIIDKYKLEAAAIGNNLLAATEEMSINASTRLKSMTGAALDKINRVKTILYFTLTLTFLSGIIVAVRLTISITRPIRKLVFATREIADGNLGYTISIPDKTEFGELVDHFNVMSVELKDGYIRLETEIAERKKTEEALRESEERYAIAARGANDGLWDWDLKHNKVYYSPRWKSMLGYKENEIGDTPGEWFNRMAPDDRKKLEAKISAHIDGHTALFESEHRVLHKDGSHLWVMTRGIAVRDESGKAYRIAGSQTDITARKTAEEQLLYDAFHDALTGLPNRALFMDRLQHAIQTYQAQSRRRLDYLYAVLFLDLDRFKVINDSLGHVMGDHLLTAVGQRLMKCLRPNDTIARLGGDEFAILIENATDMKDVIAISDRIQNDFSFHFYIDDKEIITTASAGIAFGNESYKTPDAILRDADIAMYQAKAKGKACYEIFEASMHTNVVEKLQLEADLRTALDHKEFKLHYQPIIDLCSDRLIGFEALVRWFHPKRGVVFPMEFIPLAEESGLINALGEWIFREACIQLLIWQKQYPSTPPLKMSMNISGKQFSNPGFADTISKTIKQTGVEANSLVVEITESIIMENTDTAVYTLTRLRDMGIHIHIDDFGTGYSSLSYIHRFPVNALKIDRSFVSRMSDDNEIMEIIKAIISLANSLNLTVVAEGLEMKDHLSKIKDLNCQYAQGFLFSKPLEPSAIETWITSEGMF